MKAVPIETRYRQTVLQRIWVSRDVPVTHVAKIELPPVDHSLAVHDYGFGAQPRMRMPSPGMPKVGVESPGAVPVVGLPSRSP